MASTCHSHITNVQFDQLVMIIRRTNVNELHEAILCGADVTVRNPETGGTLLHYAVYIANDIMEDIGDANLLNEDLSKIIEICRLLINNGVDPLEKSSYGEALAQYMEIDLLVESSYKITALTMAIEFHNKALLIGDIGLTVLTDYLKTVDKKSTVWEYVNDIKRWEYVNGSKDYDQDYSAPGKKHGKLIGWNKDGKLIGWTSG